LGGFGHLGHLSFSDASSGDKGSGPQRRLVGHPVEPVGDFLLLPDRGRPADQEKEGGLKRILDFLVVAQDTTAHAPDQGTMPTHQSSEGVVVSVLEKGPEQLAVRHFVTDGQNGPAKVCDDFVQRAGCHRRSSSGASLVLCL
jgi:hypothetical protein